MDEREELRCRILAGFDGVRKNVKLRNLPANYLEHFRKKFRYFESLPAYSIAFTTYRTLPLALDRFCFDAPYQIIFCARLGFLSGDTAIAVLGFDRDPLNNEEIVIKQIQGAGLERHGNRLAEWWWRRATLRALAKLRWEKMLLTLATDLAFESGFNQVRILFAESTRYYQRPYKYTNPRSIADIQERLRLRYNVTPRRLGFKKETLGHVMTRERWPKQRQKIFSKIQAS